jgi:nucleoside-diphosphate-sugar epimerase
MSVCLVTGGTGFIGSHLVEALLVRGDTVRVLDNLSSGHLENLSHILDRIDFIEGNIRDGATVQRATTGVDFIFHLAALVSVPKSMAEPIEAELINAVGTLNLLNAAKAADVQRLVLSSTCAVYGDDPTLPKTETMCPQPKSPYAISKLAAEYYCQIFNESLGLETVILRYFNIFGPRQDPSSAYSGVISIFVDKLSQGLAPTIFGNGQQTRDFVFVDDVVQANLLAAEAPKAAGEIFNIGTGRPISINQLFENLRHIFNCDLKPDYRPARTGDILHSYANPSRAKTVLGWQAQVDFEKGLKRLVET